MVSGLGDLKALLSLSVRHSLFVSWSLKGSGDGVYCPCLLGILSGSEKAGGGGLVQEAAPLVVLGTPGDSSGNFPAPPPEVLT